MQPLLQGALAPRLCRVTQLELRRQLLDLHLGEVDLLTAHCARREHRLEAEGLQRVAADVRTACRERVAPPPLVLARLGHLHSRSQAGERDALRRRPSTIGLVPHLALGALDLDEGEHDGDACVSVTALEAQPRVLRRLADALAQLDDARS